MSSNVAVAVNAVVLVLFGLAAFSRATDRLFTGFDGRGVHIFVQQFFEWTDVGLSLTGNLFEGMGDLFFVNAPLVPALAALGLAPGAVGVALAYTITALNLFVAAHLLGRALEFTSRDSLVAAWILPLLAAPFTEFALIDPIVGIAANVGDAIAANTLALALFAFAIRGPWMQRVVASILLCALVVWSMSSQPTFIVLVVPSGIGLCTALVMQQRNWSKRLTRPLLPILPLIATLAVGGASYMYGLFRATASAYFATELNQTIPRAAHLVTIAFQWKVTDWSGFLLFVAALIGLLRSLGDDTGRRRAVMVSGAIVPQAIIVVAFLVTSGGWVYPFPVYFEFVLWPIYALYAAIAIAPLVTRTAGALRCARHGRWKLAAILVVAAFLLHFQPRIPRNDIWSRVPVKDPLTGEIARGIALHEPGPFRGYAATFMGYGGANGPPADWSTLLTHGLKVTGQTGNLMRLIGFWQHAIPTLEEYQPITSPTFYLVLTRLLARKIDKQWRNVFVLTNPNLGLLEALGVRFVVADTALGFPASQRAAVTIKDIAEPIRLFELNDPNLGAYSPIMVDRVADTKAALATLADPEFNFRRRVVIFDEVSGPLVPISGANMAVERGPSYRIQATSSGRSLLLLPLQYSNCLQMRTYSGKTPRLLRANLTQAALLFEETMDVRLALRTGPFDQPGCRLKDIEEFRRIGLGNVDVGS